MLSRRAAQRGLAQYGRPLVHFRKRLSNKPPRTPSVRCASAASVDEALAPQTQDLLKLLKGAAESATNASSKEVTDAIFALEKQKLQADDWDSFISKPGVNWRLVLTTASKNSKNGFYFPIAAVQKFDSEKELFRNGVFLGPLFGYFIVDGPYVMKKKQLWFDVYNLELGLGPFKFNFSLKKGPQLKDAQQDALRTLPFFIYIYADEDIIVARGRGGGLALWAKTSPEFDAKAGVLRVY